MKVTWLCALVLLFSGCKTPGANNAQLNFYGADNQLYNLTFQNYFYMPVTDSDETIASASYESLKFLMGAFQWHEEFADSKGSVRNLKRAMSEKTKFSVIKKEIVDTDSGKKLKITYAYSDEVVFNKRMKSGPISFWMPTDWKELWQKSMVDGKPACTDHQYRTIGDFWYFWNPKMAAGHNTSGDYDIPACPTDKIQDAMVRVNANLTVIPSTKQTYPQYGRLGSQGKRVIYIARGQQVNTEADDVGAISFDDMNAYLVGDKTIEPLSSASGMQPQTMHFNVVKKETESDHRHWVYEATADGYDIEVHLGFFHSKSNGFLAFAQEGMENADMFIYSGHSGLGGYLAPTKFNNLKLPKKYQVFFFSGCSTFTYYNENYFDLKEKTTGRNGMCDLNIVSSGLEVFTQVSAHTVASLINNLMVNGKHWTWQNIMNEIYWRTADAKYGDNNQYSFDPVKYSSHYQVNGDELGPTDLNKALKLTDSYQCP